MFQKNEKPNLFEKLIYGSSQIGLNAMYTLFASYIILFYTDVKGINPASVGTVILFCKIFDGFSDLIAGQYIDTHKNKYGHCIPIILKWSLPMLVSVVLTFLVPDTTPALQLAFIFVTYNLFNTIFYTIVGAAVASLPSYAADDPTLTDVGLLYAVCSWYAGSCCQQDYAHNRILRWHEQPGCMGEGYTLFWSNWYVIPIPQRFLCQRACGK